MVHGTGHLGLALVVGLLGWVHRLGRLLGFAILDSQVLLVGLQGSLEMCVGVCVMCTLYYTNHFNGLQTVEQIKLLLFFRFSSLSSLCM